MNRIKTIKYLTGMMGISMTLFGLLKFIDPFKSWYTTQVMASELPFPSYALGIAGELLVGLAFVYALINFNQLKPLTLTAIIQSANIAVVIMMIVAIYVHTHPAVPADVLPLKIKPPVIPALFAAMAIVNGFLFKSIN